MANVDKIKLIRLIGGEELLGEILNDNGTTIVMKNPVRVMVVPSKANPENPGVGFAPFCSWTKDTEFELNKALILTTMKPIEEFLTNYTAAFSGIVVPESKLILPD